MTPTPPSDRGFTDEELRRVREFFATAWPDNPMNALISRLDAAERVCEKANLYQLRGYTNGLIDQISDDLTIWLRSKGISPSGDGDK